MPTLGPCRVSPSPREPGKQTFPVRPHPTPVLLPGGDPPARLLQAQDRGLTSGATTPSLGPPPQACATGSPELPLTGRPRLARGWQEWAWESPRVVVL